MCATPRVPPTHPAPIPYSDTRGYDLHQYTLTHFLLVLLQISLPAELKHDVPNTVLAELVNEAHNVLMMQGLHQLHLLPRHLRILSLITRTAFFMCFIFFIATVSRVRTASPLNTSAYAPSPTLPSTRYWLPFYLFTSSYIKLYYILAHAPLNQPDSIRNRGKEHDKS